MLAAGGATKALRKEKLQCFIEQNSSKYRMGLWKHLDSVERTFICKVAGAPCPTTIHFPCLTLIGWGINGNTGGRALGSGWGWGSWLKGDGGCQHLPPAQVQSLSMSLGFSAVGLDYVKLSFIESDQWSIKINIVCSLTGSGWASQQGWKETSFLLKFLIVNFCVCFRIVVSFILFSIIKL